MTRLLLAAQLAVVPAGPVPVPAIAQVQPTLNARIFVPAPTQPDLSATPLGAPVTPALLPDASMRELGQAQADAGRLAADIAQRLGAPRDEASLKSWIERTHADLRRERPDLFERKMLKASASVAAFNRAFPELFYGLLAQSPDAARLSATPRLRLAGDLHAENVEIASYRGAAVPQVDDYDDAAEAPAGLEAARAFVSAAILGRTPAQARRLFAAAREAYVKALGMSFKDWAADVSREEAVDGAKANKRHWRRDAGPALTEAEARRARTIADLNETWEAHHREGAGLSSIGVRRTLFVREGHDEAWDLKELPEESALFAFGGSVDSRPVAQRVSRAYNDLRAVPVEARTTVADGRTWIVRERPGKETSLDLERVDSSARVLGGLAAQLQRGQVADPRALSAVADALSPETASGLVAQIKELRAALIRLIEDGTWR
jgi:hypothetical protein